MLKGKKKALAAQVLLGVMIASNAYAAEFTINAQGGEVTGQPSGNTFTFSNWGSYRYDNEGTPILGGQMVFGKKIALK